MGMRIEVNRTAEITVFGEQLKQLVHMCEFVMDLADQTDELLEWFSTQIDDGNAKRDADNLEDFVIALQTRLIN